MLVRRLGALAVLLLFLGAAAWAAVAGIGSVREKVAPPPPPPAAPPPPKPLRIIFPEGFTRREMGERVAAVKRIAAEKRKKKTRISEAAYLKLTQRSALPGRFAADGKPRAPRGLPVSGDVRVPAADDDEAAGQQAADRVPAQLGEARSPLRQVEEPDAVRRPDHRVDGGEGDARARGAAARGGGDLQPAQGADAARDRRDDPLRPERPRHRVAPSVSPGEPDAVQHTPPRGPPADPDRKPGPRVDAGGRPSTQGRLPLLRPQARQGPPLLHGRRSEFLSYLAEHGYG